MTGLVSFLAAYYTVAYRRQLWAWFVGLSDAGRVMFGVCVYLLAMAYLLVAVAR